MKRCGVCGIALVYLKGQKMIHTCLSGSMPQKAPPHSCLTEAQKEAVRRVVGADSDSEAMEAAAALRLAFPDLFEKETT